MTLTQYIDMWYYFYTTAQRNMGVRKKEENPKKLISFWKEKFINHVKAHPRQCFCRSTLNIPIGIFL